MRCVVRMPSSLVSCFVRELVGQLTLRFAFVEKGIRLMNMETGHGNGDIAVLHKSRYVCVVHHPIRSAWRTPLTPPSVDTARVVFNGVLECGLHTFFDEEASRPFIDKGGADERASLEYRFWIDFDVLDDGVCVRYGFNGLDNTVEDFRDGELNTYCMPICDAMEEWEFAISQHPIDVGRLLVGFKRSELHAHAEVFENIRDLEERARFYKERR